jgi:hypothetical protein
MHGAEETPINLAIEEGISMGISRRTFQPLHDVAMQKTIGGYQVWPRRELDFRYLTKG